jgi:dipeptidyl aminopeptidase/acylaminoacyl peptidase
MRPTTPSCAALALLIGVAGPLTGQRSPTLHEWMSITAADGPSISPDGKTVAYFTVTPDWTQDGFHRDVWVVSTAGGAPRQITRDAASSSAPRWSPDGKWLAFLTAGNNGDQVFVVRAPDGAPIQLTKAENGVDDYRWSPTGRQIAYLSGESIAKPAEEPKEFHVVGNDGQYSVALWVLDVPAEPSGPVAAVRVTDPKAFAADEISWSPDGTRIAIHANLPDDPYSFWTYDIYVVDVAGKSARRIVDTPGPDFFPIWSPDGKEIAYRSYALTPGQEYYSFSQGYVAVVPAAGGPYRILTAALDEQATPLAWTADGIWFAARQGTFQQLFRVDPPTKAIKRMSEPLRSQWTSVSIAPDGKTLAFVWMDSTHYQEVFSSPVAATLTPRRLTNSEDQFAGWSLASRETMSWTSKDGTPIEGILYKPPRFDPSKTYPLVVIVHGGPVDQDQATIGRDLPYVAEMYAQRGFLVLRPNYRGSTGYGAAFRAALVGHLGAPEYEDIIGGVDLLIHRRLADSARVGVMGWSHGGYLSAFSSMYSNRFAAASVGAGVSDMRLFYSMGAGNTLKPSATTPTPWDQPDYFRRAAPITYVKQARTPTLIQHGDRDKTAPLGGAQELYRGLKDQGVPVRMILYRGAGHLPSSLKQFEMVAQHNLDWFSQYLSGSGERGAGSGIP